MTRIRCLHLDVLDERAPLAQTRLELLRVLILNADGRWRSTKEYGSHLAAMAAEQRLALFDTVIPRHQPVTDHARYGLPTIWLRPSSTIAVPYRRLAEEVASRLADLVTDRGADPVTADVAGRRVR